jgi:hypothetical protein
MDEGLFYVKNKMVGNGLDRSVDERAKFGGETVPIPR